MKISLFAEREWSFALRNAPPERPWASHPASPRPLPRQVVPIPEPCPETPDSCRDRFAIPLPDPLALTAASEDAGYRSADEYRARGPPIPSPAPCPWKTRYL